MNIGNRMPFLQLQNKSENSAMNKLKNKAGDQNILNSQDEKQPLTNLKNISNYNSNNLKKEENKIPTEVISEQRLADEEHYKCIVKALQKAIDENEDLREKIHLLIKENGQLRAEIEEKDSALIELAQFYENCQKNHKNYCETPKEKNKSVKNKRKSNSL